MVQTMTVEELREYIRAMPADEILHVTFVTEKDGKEDAGGADARNSRKSGKIEEVSS